MKIISDKAKIKPFKIEERKKSGIQLKDTRKSDLRCKLHKKSDSADNVSNRRLSKRLVNKKRDVDHKLAKKIKKDQLKRKFRTVELKKPARILNRKKKLTV